MDSAVRQMAIHLQLLQLQTYVTREQQAESLVQDHGIGHVVA